MSSDKTDATNMSNYSNSSALSKGELAHWVKAQIVEEYEHRYKGQEGAVEKEKKEGLRGEKVVRVKCCAIKALNNIIEFLDQIDQAGLIRRLSCPLSRKKGGHVNGFQCYIELKSDEDVDVYMKEYQKFQEMRGNILPKKIEHNPRSCAQKKADEERKAAEAEALRAITGSPPMGTMDFEIPKNWNMEVSGYSPAPGVLCVSTPCE